MLVYQRVTTSIILIILIIPFRPAFHPFQWHLREDLKSANRPLDPRDRFQGDPIISGIYIWYIYFYIYIYMHQAPYTGPV